MYSAEEIDRMIREANERAHSRRLERLRFLFLREDTEPAPVGAFAYEYYEEARLCWYMGAFVATIVMSQLALEEMLRSRYRFAKGVGGNLNDRVKVDDAGFRSLLEQAKLDGWLYLSGSLHK